MDPNPLPDLTPEELNMVNDQAIAYMRREGFYEGVSPFDHFEAIARRNKEIERLRVIEKAVAESGPVACDLYGGSYCIFCDYDERGDFTHSPDCAYILAGGK